ncbi:MAG TPA: hypothetical protein VFH95_04905 [Candidatus Kapabacteria bacterium]|nr:hypothetical protein [Candidatus Kapabacteria bacterium]
MMSLRGTFSDRREPNVTKQSFASKQGLLRRANLPSVDSLSSQ